MSDPSTTVLTTTAPRTGAVTETGLRPTSAAEVDAIASAAAP